MPHTQPDGYRHTIMLTVRFGDVDALGHVNHAKYLTYMEQGRICYLRDVIGASMNFQDFGVILAKATVDYHLPLAFGDAIIVYTRCSRLGSKSFDLEYVIYRKTDDGSQEVAHGLTTMVAYDYTTAQSIPVPDEWRKRMTDYEPILEA